MVPKKKKSTSKKSAAKVSKPAKVKAVQPKLEKVLKPKAEKAAPSVKKKIEKAPKIVKKAEEKLPKIAKKVKEEKIKEILKAHPPVKEEKKIEAKIEKKPLHVKHAAPVIPPKAEVKPEIKEKKAPEAIPKAPAEPEKAPQEVPAKTAPVKEAPAFKGEIKINELVTVRALSEKINVKPGDILKKLMSMGSLGTINQRLDIDTATLLAGEFGYQVKFDSLYTEEALEEEKEDPAKLKPRSPVVTIMGHVDHGKTSLLDYIRKSRVAEGEAGGITQHIGAYKVKTPKGEITFLDTPGHEAFTAMRSRGAQATDIVVLVVSAADGVMPQTVEAIDHARAAGVPIIVAINKVDIPTANPQQTRQELSKYNLISEDWGGDTIMVEVSAKMGTNVERLLEMILIKAEMMELKANPDTLAKGVVVEAKLDQKKGAVATVLIKKGKLHIGDNFVVGQTYGKVRAMTNDLGQRINEAGPSVPVEILGFSWTPQSGDRLVVVEQEYQAREIAEARRGKIREDALKPRHHLSLEDISAGKGKDLRVILKADVQGSLGALSDSLEKLSTNEINLKIIHRGIGSIKESDVSLAAASDALIIGFNIVPDSLVEKLAEKEGVSIRVYRIIYDLINDVTKAMEGLLEPQIKEKSIGKAQVKQVFKVSKIGTISGSMVTEGKVVRGAKVRLLRDNVIVYQGQIISLRRFKDDVKEVEKGFECGIGLENFSDIKSGDIVEAFTEEKIARKL
ncbi:MAG: translation initiation factor IF-2 [Elusimicrobia bacterium]|nr:translation initiation factor IF-2 [Elusimicrobiota bacterium]